jgi:polygalacturonase
MLKGHGGVVIGSEMSAGVKRVSISNCVFEGTDIGIRIKTMRGRGGVVEDVRVSNITMSNIVNEGVLITLRYQATSPEPLSERTPAVRNIQLSNLNIRNARRPVAIYGLEERAVSRISFNDIRSSSQNGILLENSSGISFHDIEMEVLEGTPFEAKDSENITYDKVTVISPVKDSPYIKLANCRNVLISNCFQPEKINNFLVKDEKCESIFLMNNILPGTEIPVKKLDKTIITQNNITANSL